MRHLSLELLSLWLCLVTAAFTTGVCGDATELRFVAQLTFAANISTMNAEVTVSEVVGYLNTSYPTSSFPTTVTAMDAQQSILWLYFEKPSYLFAVNDLVKAVMWLNRTATSTIFEYRLLDASISELSLPPGGGSSSGSSSSNAEPGDDQAMQITGYVLSALSLLCIVATHMVLRGKTLEDF